MNRLFGYRQSQPSDNAALPSSWYRSEAMYSLERRAIFSKKWMLVSHQLRINGFHNICRHRAYPLVEEEARTVKILACKYHGWSYGLNGKLAKAPRYQELDGFDKEKNSLFSIHVHIDKLGFVWVNLDAAETPAVRWEDDFAGVDEQPRLKPFDFSQYQFDHA
ncbi:Rieske (2Fe-2S) protein [Aspergillus mulundensis]|uniref:Rieske domain-containing protein n=1 Tax=Aspergillus mulundensis TaxID=1810919 RepID=A0A3D8SIU6_9EURO|nr:hypothetical protein DSM5745_02746 [Aspergillus mulundensis]RDW86104.1 hypothetical protein DSM5745_02746 [Aspergillus mulundensis]